MYHSHRGHYGLFSLRLTPRRDDVISHSRWIGRRSVCPVGDMYGDTIGVLCFYKELSLKLISLLYKGERPQIVHSVRGRTAPRLILSLRKWTVRAFLQLKT